MKIMFIAIMVSIIATENCFSQWQWVNPTPQGNTLHDMQFVNATTGFAVGDGGTILRTMDGGYNWNRLESGLLAPLNSVFFLDPLTGWAISDEGPYLLNTTDGGQTWNLAYLFDTFYMNDVWFTDTMHGVAIGYESVFITSDGGLHWTWNAPYTWNYSVWFTFPSTAIMSSEYCLYKSYDGGNTWTIRQQDVFGYKGSLFFMNADTGFHVGYFGKIFRTTDNGEHWDTIPSGTSVLLSAAYVFPNGTGYVVGDSGIMLKTNNAGASWSVLPAFTNYNLETITFSDTSHGVISGELGFIMITEDGGLTWTSPYYSINRKNLNAVVFPDQNNGYLAGSGSALLKSTNGGNSWQVIPVTDSADFTSLFFQNTQTGYVAGTGGTILKTTDAGSSWNRLNTGVNLNLNQIAFPDDQTGYVIGNALDFSDSVFLLKTLNAGATWTTTPLNDQFIYAMSFTSQDTGYYTGYYGMIKQTTDGGNSWNLQGYFPDTHFLDLSFPTKNKGFACGLSAIYQTNNAGIQWNKIYSGSLVFTRMMFLDSLKGYALANENFSAGRTWLYKTEDGGATWSDKEIGQTAYRLTDLCFKDADTGFVVGQNGVILKTVNAGGVITGINEKAAPLKEEMIISPNPCAKWFHITFQEIQESVNLKIYSVFGQELLSSGFCHIKSVIIEIPGLTPGMYLVSVKTDVGSIVKKLVVNN